MQLAGLGDSNAKPARSHLAEERPQRPVSRHGFHWFPGILFQLLFSWCGLGPIGDWLTDSALLLNLKLLLDCRRAASSLCTGISSNVITYNWRCINYWKAHICRHFDIVVTQSVTFFYFVYSTPPSIILHHSSTIDQPRKIAQKCIMQVGKSMDQTYVIQESGPAVSLDALWSLTSGGQYSGHRSQANKTYKYWWKCIERAEGSTKRAFYWTQFDNN